MLRVLVALGLTAAAYGAVARPGTLNYTEGQVSLDGRSVEQKNLGTLELEPGKIL